MPSPLIWNTKRRVLFSLSISQIEIGKKYFTEKFGAVFAAEGYSSDNAAGIAILTNKSNKK